VRRTEAALPLFETGAGFFFTTALAFDFCSDLTLRGADFAAFGALLDFTGFAAGFLAFAAGAAFFGAGFFAAGFLAAFGVGLEDLGFAFPGIAGREVCRNKPAVIFKKCSRFSELSQEPGK
jgi:hypothetical protein